MTTLKSVRAFMEMWITAQRPMTKVIRWSNFPAYGQTLTEHANSINAVAAWVIYHFRDQRFDRELVLEAVRVHDFGEPLNGGDVIYDNKTSSNDVQEWLEFRKMIAPIVPTGYRDFLERAFLLQFGSDEDVTAFDSDTRSIIGMLRDRHAFEVDLFEFIERFDYLLSAIDGFDRGIRNDVETMFEHTTKRQVGLIDSLVERRPVLSRIWTQELRSSLLNMYS